MIISDYHAVFELQIVKEWTHPYRAYLRMVQVPHNSLVTENLQVKILYSREFS